ncbi:MAG TPA: aminotransferase class V-fold PLP-dependent enzyme [Steroidobacteraceae bacterium]|nr:aminotransferase class V-fold PLP-dependent enzyme [Steroidobacteraceae bacterium]
MLAGLAAGAAGVTIAATKPVSGPPVGQWRSAFPILETRIRDRPLTYLDNAATTQRPETVLKSLLDFHRTVNANPGSTLHTLARRAQELYETARAVVAQFLNADADEIVWVRGTTEGVNLVATAWARPNLRAGDEILLTVAEHASNLLPWRLAARQAGASVRFVDVDDEGRISLEDLERKLTRRTRLFAFSHVSNVAGFINPAAEICARVRAAGARVFIDAAQSAPHIPLDVRSLGCDFLAFSGHKMLAPMGIGVLWAHRDVLASMPPYQAGSNMAHAIDLESEQLEDAGRRFCAGTPNASGAIALAAAINHLGSLGRPAIERHESELSAHGLEALQSIPGLRILGPRTAEGRVPVFSFVIESLTPLEIMRALDEEGIAIRAGDLSALPLLKRFGVGAAARASCFLYTRPDEIDRMVRVLRRLVVRK